jgi:hypothetical protein
MKPVKPRKKFTKSAPSTRASRVQARNFTKNVTTARGGILKELSTGGDNLAAVNPEFYLDNERLRQQARTNGYAPFDPNAKAKKTLGELFALLPLEIRRMICE